MPLLKGTDQQHSAFVSTVRAQETIKIPPFSELEMWATTSAIINNSRSTDWLLDTKTLS